MTRKKAVLACLILALAVAGLGYLNRDAMIDHAIRARLREQPDTAYLTDKEHIRVLLCGTGSPEVSAARAQACTLVSAGGRMFLFDVGDGAVRSLHQSKVPIASLTRLFITHFHSDHFNDLGPLLDTGWIWGRATPLDVEGPVGMRSIVAGLNQTYALDRQYRGSHMPDLARTMAAAQANPIEITFAPGARTARVYDDAGVTIDAILVAHDPVKPALGYILHYRGKKVFISGDTKVVPETFEAMKDADLVIHEAYASHLVRRAIPQMQALGMNQQAEVATRTLSYHSDTIELARAAQRARVKHLVLTHLTPYPDGWFARRLFTQGMNENYHGALTLGLDGMEIIL